MRFFQSVLIIIVCLFVQACSGDGKPPIPFTKMEKVLYGIYLAEIRAGVSDSFKGIVRQKDSTRLSEGYSAVLAHHGVDLEIFKEAMVWYTNHPLLLDSMYKRLIAHNDSLLDEYERLRQEEKEPSLILDPEERAAMETAPSFGQGDLKAIEEDNTESK